MSQPNERLEELCALVAIGAASREEERELEALCVADTTARDEARAFADAAAMMAEALPVAVAPIAALDRIRARVGGHVVTGSSAGPAGGLAPVIPFDRRRRATTVAAVVGFAAAAAFGLLWQRERSHRSADRQAVAGELDAKEREHVLERGALRDALAQAQDQLGLLENRMRPLTSPALQLAKMQGTAGGQVNVLADQQNRRWLVIALELPAPGPTADYELWFIPDKGTGKPVSGGLLQIGPDGLLSATPEVPAQLKDVVPALSREAKGGSKTGVPTEVLMAGSGPI